MRIKLRVESTQTINRSEFICYLEKCKNEDECRCFINEIRKLHPQATHVCTAYITNQRMTIKTSDDGEPSKTAGMPMLDVLQKNNLEDICACVVRYFGGIKLGETTKNRDKRESQLLSVITLTRVNLYQG